ncbi:hypothetical protein [Legionella quateirensis]|uniref:Uncharacterized protein n=1 Tax=Legionella quateirensis TaxID=45072 RepID=A0A378KXW9_9GAMM|nr:hypothetical protein [Legionella quateirensis]KTD49287.1 hypothetical protein Lqua_1739 [Legionella quateirensis]STY19383.1 Uncharacterised protein [Legionella quateirensis]
MSWWSSVVDGVKSVGTKLSNGAKWVWNNASLTKITTSLFTYPANTFFQVLEQGLAWRKAVPTLINNVQARNIVNGMAYIAKNEVLPIVALNYANNSVQSYFREGHEADPWLAPYSAFLAGLTLVHYGVKAYTYRQGVQSLMRITVLDSVGPSAFNSNKVVTPPTLCKDLDCNFKRKTKGMLREPFILAANDLIAWAISFIPYVGETTAQGIRIFFNGRYITRLVTPERCERHKAMMQESVLALGLTYEASTMIMDYILESTVGLPPFLFHRTLKHLLLLLHVNLAAHMSIPLVEDKDATLIIDPLNIYERVCRFIADVIFAGLMKRIPIDFKPVKGAPPLIPLSPALKFGTELLNSDKEREIKTAPGFFNKSFNMALSWAAPPIFKSWRDFINDPIISTYWHGIQQGSLNTVKIILSYKESKTKTTLGWVPPKAVAVAINLKFGIPKKLTQFLIMLSKEDDFWEFVEALKSWLERNNIKGEVVLVPHNGVDLPGEKKLEPTPVEQELPPSEPSEQLISTRSQHQEVIPAEQLLTNKQAKTPSNTPLSAESLFSRRGRGDHARVEVQPVGYYM